MEEKTEGARNMREAACMDSGLYRSQMVLDMRRADVVDWL